MINFNVASFRRNNDHFDFAFSPVWCTKVLNNDSYFVIRIKNNKFKTKQKNQTKTKKQKKNENKNKNKKQNKQTKNNKQKQNKTKQKNGCFVQISIFTTLFPHYVSPDICTGWRTNDVGL